MLTTIKLMIAKEQTPKLITAKRIIAKHKCQYYEQANKSLLVET